MSPARQQPEQSPRRPAHRPDGISAGEQAMDALLREAHLTPPHELAALIARHVESLGVSDTMTYLVDLQQNVLVPFVQPSGPPPGHQVTPLAVDATLAGRAFQLVEVLLQELPNEQTRVWLPLLDGSERLGVLAVTVDDRAALTADGGLLETRLRRLASVAAELITTKTLYGDTIVRLRRVAEMGVAAEIQWSVLPPLTFASRDVTIAAALEPAYQVAGDTVDYAVDAGRAQLAVFDGMGHGLEAAQLAVMSLAAYRNARRAGRSLTDIATTIDTTLVEMFGGESFSTALIAHLETDTGEFTWVNAGHPEPLLLRAGKVVRSLHVEPFLPLGIDLGGLEPAAPVVGHEHLQPGDRVLFYTDGVVEARAPGGDFFGAERLGDLVIRNVAGGLPAPETMRRVVRELLKHQAGQLSDDATLLLLEWRTHNEDALLV